MARTLMRLVDGIDSVFDFVACNQAGLLPAPVMHFLSVAAGVPKGEPHA